MMLSSLSLPYQFGLQGPLAIFCSRHEWSAPRTVDLRKQDGLDFGFSVRGDSPVIIAMVEKGSLAQV